MNLSSNKVLAPSSKLILTSKNFSTSFSSKTAKSFSVVDDSATGMHSSWRSIKLLAAQVVGSISVIIYTLRVRVWLADTPDVCMNLPFFLGIFDFISRNFFASFDFCLLNSAEVGRTMTF